MIRIRRQLLDFRRRPIAIGLSLAAICIALLLAHGAPGLDHMDDGMDQGTHAGAVISMCLGVIQAGFAVLVIVGIVALARRRFVRTSRVDPIWPSDAFGRRPERFPRAGPAALQVFLL